MHRTYTEQQDQEIATKYLAGMSYPALVREYGGSNPSIRSALRRRGVEPRKPGRPSWREFTDEQQAEIVRRWHGGESQSKIAASFGTTQTVISRYLVRHGIEPVQRRGSGGRGSTSPAWRGGITYLGGYRLIWVDEDDPMAYMRQSTGYAYEHRLVMARTLGRPLRPDETVHHINGDKLDNSLGNLQLRQGKHGKNEVAVCLDCGSQNIGFEPLA